MTRDAGRRRIRTTRSSSDQEEARRGDKPFGDGVPPESLDAVLDFVREIDKGSVNEDDRWLHGSHPLVLLARNVLEAISAAHLGVTIANLNHSSKEQIASSRRKLEQRDQDEELQVVLFWFEQICDLVQDVGYRSEGSEEARKFFSETFLEWLASLELWAEERNDEPLKDACARAWKSYVRVSDRVVVENDE